MTKTKAQARETTRSIADILGRNTQVTRTRRASVGLPVRGTVWLRKQRSSGHSPRPHRPAKTAVRGSTLFRSVSTLGKLTLSACPRLESRLARRRIFMGPLDALPSEKEALLRHFCKKAPFVILEQFLFLLTPDSIEFPNFFVN